MSLLVPPVELKNSTPSRQGDYRLKGGVNQARLIAKYLNDERYRQVFPKGFPFAVLQHLGLDGASSNMSKRVGLSTCLQRYITSKQVVPRPRPLLVKHCSGHQLDLLMQWSWNAVPYLEKSMDPALTGCYLWTSTSANRATKLREVAEALGVTGTIKKADGRRGG